MEINMKKTGKYVGAACAATGVVVLSGLVASGAAVGAVVEGFKSAGATMRKMLKEEPQADTEINVEAEVVEVDTEMVAETSSGEKENEEILEN